MTRRRVIDAAIEVFGRRGYEQTTTRAIVERAGTNLVAIHYHFGGKEALYRAAGEHIAAFLRRQNERLLDEVRAVAARPLVSRAELVDCICTLANHFVALAAGGAHENWRRFVVREQAEPSGCFEIMFAAMRPFYDIISTLISRLIDRPPTDPEVYLLAMMIFGQLSVFRTNRAAALKILGWRRVGPRELGDIQATTRKYVFKLFDERPPRTAPAAGRRPRLSR